MAKDERVCRTFMLTQKEFNNIESFLKVLRKEDPEPTKEIEMVKTVGKNELQKETFTPILLTGDNAEQLGWLFDGRVSRPGDAVELVCYATTEKSVSLKWRVKGDVEDPEAWQEICLARQAAGVRYEFNFGTSLEPIWRYRLCEFLGEKEEYREVVETPKPPFPDLGGIQNIIRKALNIQGQHGIWNYDPYMHGMYDGMEYALSVAENREPQYKDAPANWLHERKVIEETPKPTLPHLESRKLWLAQREAGTNEVWQIRNCGGQWADVTNEPKWWPDDKYRSKPKTEWRYMALLKNGSRPAYTFLAGSAQDIKEHAGKWGITIIGEIVEREVEL